MQPKRSSTRAPSDAYRDQGRLDAISLILNSRIDDVFGELGVGLVKTSKMYFGSCPIHSGDRVDALNYYPTGTTTSYWRCWTRGCQRHFKPTTLGFIRGVLTQQKYGWAPPRSEQEKRVQKTVSFKEAVDWGCRFIGKPLETIEVDYAELEKRQFASGISILTRSSDKPPGGFSRPQVRERLTFPARYLVSRGWAPEVLNEFDVGYCGDSTKPFFERCVVPIFDVDHKWVVGFSARTIHSKCGQCSLWHATGVPCPPPSDALRYSKWRFSEGFRREAHLYNLWNAKRSIAEHGIICICEGPGDVWRLVESGIQCGVGLFGVSLSDPQQIAIEMSGARDVIVLTNSDAAGLGAHEDIRKRLGRSFRLHFPKIPANDLGDLRPDEVGPLIVPLINKIKERGF